LIQFGDDVHNAKDGTGEVEHVTTEQTTQEMYNLTVDEAHTFYVGDGQWLVHNACDFRRIAYGSDELSRAVQQTRIDWGLPGEGTNVAAFQMDGDLPPSLIDEIHANPDWFKLDNNLIIAKNAGGGGSHSEEIILDLLRSHGIDSTQVTAVYSELSPCRSCSRLLNQFSKYGNKLPVTFSFQYPNESIVKYTAVKLLLERRYPGIIVP
jgi:Xanthomonas XOO_2897-like deaminase